MTSACLTSSAISRAAPAQDEEDGEERPLDVLDRAQRPSLTGEVHHDGTRHDGREEE